MRMIRLACQLKEPVNPLFNLEFRTLRVKKLVLGKRGACRWPDGAHHPHTHTMALYNKCAKKLNFHSDVAYNSCPGQSSTRPQKPCRACWAPVSKTPPAFAAGRDDQIVFGKNIGQKHWISPLFSFNVGLNLVTVIQRRR